MSFKKLNKQLTTAMEACGFEAPNEYQKYNESHYMGFHFAFIILAVINSKQY